MQSEEQVSQGSQLRPFEEYFQNKSVVDRLFSLAKLKQQIMNLPALSMHPIIEFLQSSFTDPREVRMFMHVVAVSIKHSSSQDHFRWFVSELTEYLDANTDKITLVFALFTEIIDTIQHTQSKQQSPFTQHNHPHNHPYNIPRCKFQRYFTNHFLNEMLSLSNHFLGGFVKKADGYEMEASAEEVCAVLELLHTSFTYDFTGEDAEESCSPLILPTKFSRYADFSQFERWSRLSEWLEIYHHIFLNCDHRAKILVLEILGDMARIHMRYFRTKAYFRTHVENIASALASILNYLNLATQQNIHLALVLGCSLQKLSNCAALALFTEMSASFLKAFLASISNFVVEQILQQSVLNTHLLRYYFNFFNALCVRSSFQRGNALESVLQVNINYIGRNYQPYLRSVIGKAFKNKHFNGVQWFKEALDREDIAQLQLFFLPFRCYRVRRVSIDSIQELVLVVCSRAEKCMSYVEVRKSEEWERETCVEVLQQCLDKVEEWYGFAHAIAFDNSTSTSMSVIKEVTEEEVDNEDQYLHFIRVLLLYLLQKINHQDSLTPPHVYHAPHYPKTRLLVLSLHFIVDHMDPTNNRTLTAQTLRTLHTLCDPLDKDDPYWLTLQQISSRLTFDSEVTEQLQDLAGITLLLSPIINLFTCAVYLRLASSVLYKEFAGVRALCPVLESFVMQYQGGRDDEMKVYIQCLALIAEAHPRTDSEIREVALNRLLGYLLRTEDMIHVPVQLEDVTLHACRCLLQARLVQNILVKKVIKKCRDYAESPHFILLINLIQSKQSSNQFLLFCIDLGSYACTKIINILQTHLSTGNIHYCSETINLIQDLQNRGYSIDRFKHNKIKNQVPSLQQPPKTINNQIKNQSNTKQQIDTVQLKIIQEQQIPMDYQIEKKKASQIYAGYHRDVTIKLAQKYLFINKKVEDNKNQSNDTADQQSQFDNFSQNF